ncbi:hypothetical protein, partial [Bifidobacterium adolescentis]
QDAGHARFNISTKNKTESAQEFGRYLANPPRMIHRILPRTRMICPFPIPVDASHVRLHYFARHHDGNTRRNPCLAPDSSSDRYPGGSYAVSPILL